MRRLIADWLIGVLAQTALAPLLFRYYIEIVLYGREMAFNAIAERVSLISGVFGIIVRRKLYQNILTRCGANLDVRFGTIFSKPSLRVGNNVYIGSFCCIGNCEIGDDTLIADSVCIPSGARQHGMSRLDIPMRLQEGVGTTVSIGADCWIGSGAILLADMGAHSVAGAGAVVTKPVGEYEIVAG